MKSKNKFPTLGVIIKIALLGFLNAFSLWAIPVLISNKTWLFAIYFAISTLIIDYIFLRKKIISPKYIVPGVILLIAFQVYPAMYTGYVAFTNLSTGHFISKTEAISQLEATSQQPVAGRESIPMRVVKSKSDGTIYLLFNKPDGTPTLGGEKGFKDLPTGSVYQGSTINLPGYTVLNDLQINDLTDYLTSLHVPTGPNSYIQVIDFGSAQEVSPALKYDKAKDQMVNQNTGVIYSPNSTGSFVSQTGDELEPGWTTTVGWRNFTRIFTDSRYRAPLGDVLWWTFAYAFLVVFTTFFLGFFLSLVLNHEKLRAKKIYRSLLIIPYAMPSVLSILVWSGFFNQDYGVINRILHTSLPWLTDPWLAKAAVLLVQLWLGTPYMFLISTGAIQSLPSEIVEAAQVDGASAGRIFRSIKLPLVLASLSPLLIASYAYNFSNFGGIYLLTGGGPSILASGGVAGSTDILISYTYKLAFISGKGSEYGLASAVSFINFIIVGTLSIYSFLKSKSMENMS